MGAIATLDAPTDTADNPCTPAWDPVNQDGRVRHNLGREGANGSAVVDEIRYDAWGRVVATRRGVRTNGAYTFDATWSCTTFDARMRPTTVTVPNLAGTATERTITTTYSAGGNPLATWVGDSNGTIKTETDLLGRVVSYTDVLGTTTTSTYDTTGKPGRLAQTVLTTPASVVAATNTWDYDRSGRLTKQYLDGTAVATPTYNPPGNANEQTLASVTYDTNGTSLASIGRNTNGTTTSLSWSKAGSTFFTDTVTRSQTGRVVTDAITGTNTTGFTSSYEYDTAGRLTKATQPGHVLQYGYGAQTGCSGINLSGFSGANSNRTSLIDNGATTATYCYDVADRLISTTAAGYGSTISYDAHGNTTALGGETLGYDGADRHTTTTANGVTVTYTRDVTDRIVARTSPAAGTAPAFRAAGTVANNGTGSTSLSLDRPTTAVANDLLLAAIVTTGTTVTAPAGWTQVATSGSVGVQTTVFSRLATATDPTNWAFTLAASGKAAGRIVAYSGVHTGFPIDVTATSTTASGTVHNAPQVTTTDANRQILTIVSVAASTTMTPSAGTERIDTRTATGTPSATIELAEASQSTEGLSTQRSATAAAAGVGAEITVALRPANSTTTTRTVRYSYSGGGDGTALELDTANNLLSTTITLPGGVVLTKQSATLRTFAYPNIHGDTTYTINHQGTIDGPYFYDSYGNPLTTIANTNQSDLDNGWLGQHQRPTEHNPDLKPTIEMGARPYRPVLGRFLRIDPIPDGATKSAYGYVDDSINEVDINGEEKCKKDRKGDGEGKSPKGGHTKGGRPSTEGKHEKGEQRRGKDQPGVKGEKGDKGRPYRGGGRNTNWSIVIVNIPLLIANAQEGDAGGGVTCSTWSQQATQVLVGAAVNGGYGPVIVPG